MKLKLPDILLISAVVVALGFIFWSLGKRKAQDPIKTEAGGQTLPEILQQVETSVKSEIVQRKASWAPINDELIAALKANGINSLEQSPVCAEQGKQPMEFVSVERLDVIQAIESNIINFHLGDPRSRCYRVGSRLNLMLFDRLAPAAPFVRQVGSVQVKAVFVAPIAKIPDQLFKSLGIGRHEYKRFFGIADPATIVLFDDYKSLNSDVRLSRLSVFPKVEILTTAEFERLMGDASSRVVIDVRSKNEMVANPIAGATPFEVDSKGRTSVTNLSRQEVVDLGLDTAKLLSYVRGKNIADGTRTALIVASAGSADPKAAAVLLTLANVGTANLFWLQMP